MSVGVRVKVRVIDRCSEGSRSTAYGRTTPTRTPVSWAGVGLELGFRVGVRGS